MAGNSNAGIHVSRKRARRRPSHTPAASEAPGGERALSGEERERWEMIAAAAYFRAEKRGFAPGKEIDDWIAAEREITDRLDGNSKPLFNRLRRERDELRVQLHLARLDLHREWDELERKWGLVRARSGGALRGTRNAGWKAEHAAEALLGEIRDGYRRIRASLQVTP
jgi:hypothetical protein